MRSIVVPDTCDLTPETSLRPKNDHSIQHRSPATQHGACPRNRGHGQGLRGCGLRHLLDRGSLSVVAETFLRGAFLDRHSRRDRQPDQTHSTRMGNHFAVHASSCADRDGSARHAGSGRRPLPARPRCVQDLHEGNRRGRRREGRAGDGDAREHRDHPRRAQGRCVRIPRQGFRRERSGA